MPSIPAPYFDVWPDLDAIALHLGDEAVSYGELGLLGVLTGRLRQARATTERSLRSSRGAEVTREEVRAAAVVFRQQRRLQSGEDLRAWLAARRLGVGEWEQYLRRVLSRDSLDGRDPPSSDGLRTETASEATDLNAALAVDLACDGFWREMAGLMVRLWSAGRLLAECDGADGPSSTEAGGSGIAPVGASVSELTFLGELDDRWGTERLGLLASRRRALELMEGRYADEALVAVRLRDRAADWTSFVFDEIRLPTRTAGQEAMLCAREDGLTPEEIARRSESALATYDRRREALHPEVAAALLGGLRGEAIGPVADGDGSLVLWLRERRPPSPDDPELRSDAAAELLEEALERVSAGHVRETGPL